MEGELRKYFMKRNWKKQLEESLKLKKYSKEKMMSYMSNGKAMIIPWIVPLKIKMQVSNISFFFQKNILVVKQTEKKELNICDYATKSGLMKYVLIIIFYQKG